MADMEQKRGKTSHFA
jgi:hypothetical protein